MYCAYIRILTRIFLVPRLIGPVLLCTLYDVFLIALFLTLGLVSAPARASAQAVDLAAGRSE
jgi:hypothetical protein